MSKKNENKNSAVANMVNLLRERDTLQGKLDDIEEKLQEAIFQAAQEVPSCKVETKTWTDPKHALPDVTGKVVEGQFEIRTEGVKRLLTLMSRINKGEKRFSHAVRGWNTKGNVAEELACFDV